MIDSKIFRFFVGAMLGSLALTFLVISVLLALMLFDIATGRVCLSSNEPSLTNSVVMGEASTPNSFS